MELTSAMKQVLKAADLETKTVSGVSHSTARALRDRGLISADWKTGNPTMTKAQGPYPVLKEIKLTEAGVQAAKELLRLAKKAEQI